MTTDRHDQILNHVAEEWVDLKQTNFATKAELCEVILRLLNELDDARLCHPSEPFIGPLTLLDSMFMDDAKRLEGLIAQIDKDPPRISSLIEKPPLPDGLGYNFKSIP